MKSASGIDMGDCPGCHGDLEMEEDTGMASGYALVCNNGECSEHGGAWAAPLALVERLRRAGELPVVCDVVSELPAGVGVVPRTELPDRVKEALLAAFYMGGWGV